MGEPRCNKIHFIKRIEQTITGKGHQENLIDNNLQLLCASLCWYYDVFPTWHHRFIQKYMNCHWLRKQKILAITAKLETWETSLFLAWFTEFSHAVFIPSSKFRPKLIQVVQLLFQIDTNYIARLLKKLKF